MLAIYKGRQKRGGFVTGGTYKIETRLACAEIGRWIAVKEANERNGYEKLYLNVEDFLTEWRLISGEEEGMSFMRYNIGDRVILKKGLTGIVRRSSCGNFHTKGLFERPIQEPLTITEFQGGYSKFGYVTGGRLLITDDMIDHERTEELSVKKDINWLEDKLIDMKSEIIEKREPGEHWFSSVTETAETLIIEKILGFVKEVDGPSEKKYRVILKGSGGQVAFLHKNSDKEVTEGSVLSYYLNNWNKNTELTEKEIRDYNEWYWRFAVEVKDED